MQIPQMQRRHFQFIADVIRKEIEYCQQFCGSGKYTMCNSCWSLKRLAKSFADKFPASNGLFKRGKFLEACGLEEE